MPIRLTIGYGARLAKERFEAGSQLRRDIILLCEFWKKTREVEATSPQLKRSQFLRVVQEQLSASSRILSEDAILNCTFLKPHEKFELGFLTAVITSCIGAFSTIVDKIKACSTKPAPSDNDKERRNDQQILSEKLDNFVNVQISFLIGSNPNQYVKPFMRAALATIAHILEEKNLEFERSHDFESKFVDASVHHFEVWLSSDSGTAKWVSDYLNFQHQKAWTTQVSDDVKSIQQALAHWLQPTSDAAKKRAEAWGRYKHSLLELPDQKETMFAEQFGVRQVFVQPVANYKVSGITPESGARIPDVANLIAGLISERVPGDELILLCGGPGSGKSTLCRIVASELATNAEMHPLFLRLRRLQDGQDIPSFVESHLQKEGIIDKFSDLADVSNLVLILDGFDELVMASRSRLREFFNTLREDLVTGPLRNAKAIVSGRDTLFPNGAGLPTGSHVISLLPFDKPRITVWGEKWRTLHPTERGKRFQPEAFFDEKANNGGSKAPPLHHLVSWPLTLHLVARVHDSGVLELTKAAGKKVEKAVLYKSIVAQTALRQQEQSGGKGRLRPEQMREFVQAISWEMYSTSRDALDYNEGLPLLKGIYPDASEVELAEFADVAIVNQPELTKGEEGGFEFVHKSFSEYFVAEKFAHTVEKICFKSQDYDSDKLTWRMSVKEAINELSSLISIRVMTAEVQEMCEPMLADFKSFLKPPKQDKTKTPDLIEKIATKKARLEELIAEYATGNYQADVVDRVRGSKIVGNEREIHANFCVGLLIIGCAIAKRLAELHTKKSNDSTAVYVDEARLWKLIAVIQSGDIQIDSTLAERCLVHLRVHKDGKAAEVLYPPIPTRFLTGIGGVNFAIENAAGFALDVIATLLMENMLLTFFGDGRGGPREFERNYHDYRQARGRSGMAFSELSDRFHQIGVVSDRVGHGFRHDLGYFERNMEELIRRISRSPRERGPLNERDLAEFRHRMHEFLEGALGGRTGYARGELHERLDFTLRRLHERL